jgi:hypothetical protein
LRNYAPIREPSIALHQTPKYRSAIDDGKPEDSLVALEALAAFYATT